MFRRTFISNSVATVAATWASLPSTGIYHKNRKKKLILPSKIREGGTVALIAPSSPPASPKIDKAIANLKAMGFVVQPGQHLRDQNGYLAGRDEDRVADIHNAFLDPKIDAVWCVRGGYGCTRILHLLDMDLIRSHPKPLIGYSDITALHLALYQQARLVSFHGQVGGGDMTEFTLRHIQRSLLGVARGPFAIPPFYQNMRLTPDYEPYVIHPGTAQGPLIGGNLTLLASMIGTDFAPQYKDHVVFIEEIGEAPYRIDRLLTQLLHGTDLCDAKGIVLGVFSDCIQKGDTPTLTLRECLQDRLAPLGIPVYYGAPFGHISDQCVLPYGVMATINADEMTLTLLESGVS
jgi:muramoyltetrapeptide carboxypeptidase